MVTSNSSIDFISLANATAPNGAEELLKDPEVGQWLKEHLATSFPITVTFTKKDGTERKMLCTRNFDLIPKAKHPKTDVTTVKTPSTTDAIQAFDLEINEWRSFNASSIKRIEWAL
jgi:hypothetical protein